MAKSNGMSRLTWVKLLNGLHSDPIWTREEGESTFHTAKTDTQCGLPLPALKELEQIPDNKTQ